MKLAIGVVALVVVCLVAFITWSPAEAPVNNNVEVDTSDAEMTAELATEDKKVVSEGEYAVDADKSSVSWAGKKPLIEGYVNSGSIGVTEGSVSVAENVATGVFKIDMNTLSVFSTPAKPGKESMLESHLKGERWFNVEAFPEAMFTITEVIPRSDSETTFVYDVKGDLTMKGVTGELLFPATIYQDENGLLNASASFEFDRTKWGITAGSGSVFDNLADNVVDDMVALSFELVAKKQE